MPIIAYKTVTINIHYAQGRRIDCEHCHQPFTYIVDARKSAQSTGLPLISSDEGMGKSAMKGLSKSLASVAGKINTGHGICPHCSQYQSWMVRSSKIEKMIFWMCVFGVTGAFSTLAALIHNERINGLLWLVVATFIGISLGIVIGFLRSLKGGVHRDLTENETILSMNDESLQVHLDDCAEKDYDPMLAWLLMTGFQPNEDAPLVSLGFNDYGKEQVIPYEISSVAALEELE